MKPGRAFHVARVCGDCPYRRTGGVRLTRGRTQELIRYATDSQGARFICHKTSGVMGRVRARHKDQQCAGALIFGEKQGAANQITRIMERIGCYDRDVLMATPETADVFDTPAEMLGVALRRRR